jgi:hypothetical protein
VICAVSRTRGPDDLGAVVEAVGATISAIAAPATPMVILLVFFAPSSRLRVQLAGYESAKAAQKSAYWPSNTSCGPASNSSTLGITSGCGTAGSG